MFRQAALTAGARRRRAGGSLLPAAMCCGLGPGGRNDRLLHVAATVRRSRLGAVGNNRRHPPAFQLPLVLSKTPCRFVAQRGSSLWLTAEKTAPSLLHHHTERM